MIHIALVDDSKTDQQLVVEYMERFQKETGVAVKLHQFFSGINFIEDYEPIYDVVFMDISMPHMNGMDIAHILRQKDTSVILIFLTTMAKYAVEGYEVDAKTFLVKPVSYIRFSIELNKIINTLKQREQNPLLLDTNEGVIRVGLRELIYAQSDKHYVIFHTELGDFKVRAKLSEYAYILDLSHFISCSKSCIVNVDFIQKIVQDTVYFSDCSLVSISRSHKKSFMAEFAQSLGGVDS